MTVFEQEDCLKSMTIIVDTREQRSDRAEKRYKAFSVPYRRQKLDFGDYSACFMLPDGSEKTINAAIERKADLDELSSCFTHGRGRFQREFERAKLAGASMYLLVENASWENLMNGRYGTKFNPKAFMASMTAWIARYDIKPVFCKSESSGKIIKEILYRELKERLESGEYG